MASSSSTALKVLACAVLLLSAAVSHGRCESGDSRAAAVVVVTGRKMLVAGSAAAHSRRRGGVLRIEEVEPRRARPSAPLNPRSPPLVQLDRPHRCLFGADILPDRSTE